ncbi:hypothetical protein GGI07_002896 [Coemansia sp. Benny D115]|nr:hypothetical protein GGI07_002896 [Coemansia sp. Benny D115]
MSAASDTKDKVICRPSAALAVDALSKANSCAVLVGTAAFSQQLALPDPLANPAIQAALRDGAPEDGNAQPTDGSSAASETYSALSSSCGLLARAPRPKLAELLDRMLAAGVLTRVYTESVYSSLFVHGLHGPGGQTVPDGDSLTRLEAKIVAFNGCIDKFLCGNCSAASPLTQAVLFKAMCGQQVTCAVCGDRAVLTNQLDANGHGLVPDVFRAKENTLRAMEAAQTDFDEGIDLLLVLGSLESSAQTLSVITATLTQAADKVMVIDSDIDAFVLEITSLLKAQESTNTASASNPHDSAGADAPEPLLSAATQATLVEAASDADDTDEGSHIKNGTAPINANKSSAKAPRGAKGRTRERTNLNHLLNFTLPARMPSPLPTVRPRRRAGAADSWAASERQTQINKSMFINANFRFALKPSFWQAFMPIASRADMQLRWEWIERMIMPVLGEAAACPICLSPPTAARVTKCGHVFCYPCVLRYLSYDSADSACAQKCPICWAPVAYADLLPVHFRAVQYRTTAASHDSGPEPSRNSNAATKLAAGSHVTMRLMKRLRRTTVCLPRSGSAQIYSDELIGRYRAASKEDGSSKMEAVFDAFSFPWTFTEGALAFAKSMLADHAYSKAEYERELAELLDESNSQDSDPAAQMFVESAAASITESIRSVSSPASQDKKLEELTIKKQAASADAESASADQDDFLYFYQADDGQHIYMHPLYMRVLAHEHSDFAALPDVLHVTLRHSVESTITDDVRQRFRFLEHLSLRCDVVFVEPELKGLVSRKTIDKFRAQLSHRDKQHASRAKQAALDEARSDYMAAAMQAQSSGIRYRVEWTREGHNRYEQGWDASSNFNRVKPDESSFPALAATKPSGANAESQEPEPSQHKALWPRQPLPSSHTSNPDDDSFSAYLWQEFERAANIRQEEHDAAAHDEHDFEDPEDFYVETKQSGSSTPSRKTADGYSKKSKKGLKLVLTGGSARRRR